MPLPFASFDWLLLSNHDEVAEGVVAVEANTWIWFIIFPLQLSGSRPMDKPDYLRYEDTVLFLVKK